MNKIYVLLPVLVLAALVPLTANASGILKITYPDQNATVPANQFLSVNGTSAPSNATHNCNVQLQVNQHGYKNVTALGPKGPTDYTKWSTITTEMMKIGRNIIEGQIQCFGVVPGNATGGVNLLHHLVHNITAQ